MMLFNELTGLSLVLFILGLVPLTFQDSRNSFEEEHLDEHSLEGDTKHRLDISPEPPINGAFIKRVDDSLDLTCRVVKVESGPFSKWQLEWHLPQNLNHKLGHITIKSGAGNSLQLSIRNLQETDGGKYRCIAHNDKSSILQSSVEISILAKKGTCGDGMFSCSLPGSCIPRRYLCDGQKDCMDGADESKEFCGESPCDGKLHCEDGRCISKRFCCDRYLDANCSATYEIPCCKMNFLPPDFPIHTHQQFNEIGFLQSTMYTIIGCAVAFVIILSFTIIAVCRVHVRRSALTSAYAAYRSDPRIWSDLDTYLASNTRWTRGFLRSDLSRSPGLVLNSYGVNDPSASTLLVTYNINHGVQLVGRPIEPPPYEEVAVQVAREEPPPPYASRENLNQTTPHPVNNGQLQSRNNNHTPFLSALFSLLVSSSHVGRGQGTEEDNNNGDINGNNTGQVWVQANNNHHEQEVVTNQLNLNPQLGAGSVAHPLEFLRERESSHRPQIRLQAVHPLNSPSERSGNVSRAQQDGRPTSGASPIILQGPAVIRSSTRSILSPLDSAFQGFDQEDSILNQNQDDESNE